MYKLCHWQKKFNHEKSIRPKMQVACVPTLLAFWCLSLRGVGTWHTTPFTQQNALVESALFFVGPCKLILCNQA